MFGDDVNSLKAVDRAVMAVLAVGAVGAVGAELFGRTRKAFQCEIKAK